MYRKTLLIKFVFIIALILQSTTFVLSQTSSITFESAKPRPDEIPVSEFSYVSPLLTEENYNQPILIPGPESNPEHSNAGRATPQPSQNKSKQEIIPPITDTRAPDSNALLYPESPFEATEAPIVEEIDTTPPDSNVTFMPEAFPDENDTDNGDFTPTATPKPDLDITKASVVSQELAPEATPPPDERVDYSFNLQETPEATPPPNERLNLLPNTIVQSQPEPLLEDIGTPPSERNKWTLIPTDPKYPITINTEESEPEEVSPQEVEQVNTAEETLEEEEVGDGNIHVVSSLGNEKYIQIASYQDYTAAENKALTLIADVQTKSPIVISQDKILIYKNESSQYYRLLLGPFSSAEIGLRLVGLRQHGFSSAYVVSK